MNENISKIELRDTCLRKNQSIFSWDRDQKADKSNIDDLQIKKRLKFTIESTSFSYSVFVVWKTINDKKKKRVIVDIRNLNFIILSDAYSLSLQKNIIAAIKECQCLLMIDCAFFFYQWRVHLENKHKFIVISHRDQRTFQIAIMKYKNSFAYVQRQVDRLFRELIFVKIFIDDIIIFFKNFDNHFAYLKKMFFIFITNKISINLKKTFLNYAFVQLLNQRVDSFELSTNEKKLKIIFKLKFFRTLKQLKTYLDLIDWMTRYVSHYFTVSQSLQNRKIVLSEISRLLNRSDANFSHSHDFWTQSQSRKSRLIWFNVFYSDHVTWFMSTLKSSFTKTSSSAKNSKSM
jgi:hypothetical protein